MSRAADHQALADAVGEHMAGQIAASKFIESLRTTHADPDALLFELQRANASPARARGFARVLQKALERAGGPGHA